MRWSSIENTMLQYEIVIKFWVSDEEVINWQVYGYFMGLI
ncbi:hypothetical protein DOT_1639 [Desulfosporosinus sp. OT]|nr:hypothetical protein DOT_1639 [Desulfosporosinus sp. OT]